MNLMEGLLEELNRNRQLKLDYDEIGTAGTFGATMIQADIDAGEKAIGTGDVTEILRVYQSLKGNE